GTIAHALEKTKYEDSDVKWKELDPKYHFSCQFMADTIAMNASDFIITSTYQEIAGRHQIRHRHRHIKTDNNLKMKEVGGNYMRRCRLVSDTDICWTPGTSFI
ncbi:sucrose synthase 6-like, partial [Trifolium medium]|nr:sucrose synthase 6-like [Trifolium medium]